MRIGELAATGVDVDTIRYYEREMELARTAGLFVLTAVTGIIPKAK